MIEIDGERISGRTRAELRPFRKHVQMVFQDPYASLNPRQRVGDIIALGPTLNGVSREQAIAEARELLRLVGLKPDAVDRYPHEFSGGQRQRIGIARALAVKPKLIVADEPVSALDVSVQKQVLDLLNELRKSFGLSMLFITHDLRVAATVCEEIAIMQRGEIVERGATAEIFAAPADAHPTRAAFSMRFRGANGSVASVENCRFRNIAPQTTDFGDRWIKISCSMGRPLQKQG